MIGITLPMCCGKICHNTTV